MGVRELLQAGNLKECITALGSEVRDNPTDSRRRTFLFELLCFAGEYDRAEKHLDVLAQHGKDADWGALLYRAALSAERTRNDLFGKRNFSSAENSSGTPGTLNGRPFGTLEDADPRVGPRLEAMAAGTYLWIPFSHIASITIEPPKKLRDLLWTPAFVVAGPDFKGMDLGEVFLPALSPFSWKHPDDRVKLGRSTEWEEDSEFGAVPFGQKLFVMDGQDDIPFLEVRTIMFEQAAAAAAGQDGGATV